MEQVFYNYNIITITYYIYTSDSKKFSILKKGIGIEGEKLLKQVRGQKQVREWKQVKDGAKGSLYVE